ncbi:hypothetical protein ACFVVP_26070 [Streptomyces sp. NPDC058128]|uniref:hypothetical protein n=1 Tax=Streptomyces sp. NPDC058128 TaxID=3346352 RepID=UPI0036E7E143
MSTTPDPRAILDAWLAGSYVRADGQPVVGRAWDDDTVYRYTTALADWSVYPPGQAPYDQSWFAYIGTEVWHFTADDIRAWADQLTNQDSTVMSEAARARAASAVRSFYKHCEDALGATSWRLPRRSQLVGSVPVKEPKLLSRDQMEALRFAADGYRGPMPERARLAVYFALAGLRPGQAIGLALLQIQRHDQNAPTWRLPAKNNSASAVAAPVPIPLPVVWALDYYLPVRTWKPPHSSETTGPVLVSRLGRGLDRVTFPKLIRAVAATHPFLTEDAAALVPDVIARSPAPFPT